jgi:hypothetical protein
VVGSFFPARLEAAALEEGDHRHQRGTVEPGPGSALEVAGAEFLLHLLMRLLANPSGLDGSDTLDKIDTGRQVGEVLFLFA